MHGYLTTAMGYVFLAVFYAISGYYFFSTSLAGNTTDFSYVFSSMFSTSVFLIPILTMRLFSEERRHKTEQALFTAPVKFSSVVLGKFFASLCVFAIGLSITLLYALVLSFFQTPDMAVFFGHFLGMLLLGGALCAIGLFISSLTENQIVAAVGAMAIGTFLMLIDSFTSILKNPFLSSICTSLSFFEHFQDFSVGVLNLSDVIFFLSVMVLFLYLTIRHLESLRIS